jgi:hypothetical protein
MRGLYIGATFGVMPQPAVEALKEPRYGRVHQIVTRYLPGILGLVQEFWRAGDGK